MSKTSPKQPSSKTSKIPKASTKKSSRQKSNEWSIYADEPYIYPWSINITPTQAKILRVAGMVIAPASLMWGLLSQECSENMGGSLLIYAISLIAVAVGFSQGKRSWSWSVVAVILGVAIGGFLFFFAMLLTVGFIRCWHF